MPIVVVCGPTASGKTALAIQVAGASAKRCEIVNADSVQIYRRLDIGSAKPTPEEKKEVVHHLIDIREPDQYYSAVDFARDADQTLQRLDEEGKRAIIVGGTGLYLRALLEGIFEDGAPDPALRERLQAEMDALGGQAMHQRLQQIDPTSAQRIHPNDSSRIRRALEVALSTGSPISQHHAQQPTRAQRYRTLKIGIAWPRAELYARINQRVDRMREEGLMDEVRALMKMGYGPKDKALRAIGYKESLAFLAGEISEEFCWESIKTHSRRLAKRQMTWYRPDSEIRWFAPGEEGAALQMAERFFDE